MLKYRRADAIGGITDAGQGVGRGRHAEALCTCHAAPEEGVDEMQGHNNLQPEVPDGRLPRGRLSARPLHPPLGQRHLSVWETRSQVCGSHQRTDIDAGSQACRCHWSSRAIHQLLMDRCTGEHDHKHQQRHLHIGADRQSDLQTEAACLLRSSPGEGLHP